MARSRLFSLCTMLPPWKRTSGPVIRTPLPSRWPLIAVPPSMDSNCARAPLKPKVETLAMLSPTTWRPSPKARMPLLPV
jgi:hypothetical protein